MRAGGIFPLRIISLSPSATCCAVLIRLTTKPSIPSTSASVVVLVLHNSLCYCRVQSIRTVILFNRKSVRGLSDMGDVGAHQRRLETLDAVPKLLFIDGKWRPATNDQGFAVFDPATGEELCVVADASVEDAVAALHAAVDAKNEWEQCAPRQRSDVLRTACDLLLDRMDMLALLMTMEMGKPLSESRGEVEYAADFLRWFSEEAVRIGGDFSRTPDGTSRTMVIRQPVGPCLLITPWNFPLAMGARKIGPALAAGCTVILKPAPQTPLSSLALAAVFEDAGLPAGVLNVITTSRAPEVVEHLLQTRALRKPRSPARRRLVAICLNCADPR